MHTGNMTESEATVAMQAAAAAAAKDADQWARSNCPTCERSYKFYCPTCSIAVGVPEGVRTPSLVLPLQVHIWFQDKIKKSTAPHAKVLAPQDVEIVPYPLSEQHTATLQYDRETTLVVYPTITAEVMPEMSTDDLAKFQTLVFIDCPWQKAPVILQHDKLANLRCVKLAKPPSESKFWRYHQAGPGCVSTIEAIQLMLQDYVDAAASAGVPLRDGAAATNLEELLFFFKMLYSQIAERYEKDPRKNRKPPMSEEEKERQRLIRSQKELGKKRKLETKREHWSKVTSALASGEISAIPRGNDRCFNCKEPGHEAKQCPNPCRYCKQPDHFSGKCSMKKLRQEATSQQHQRITKAL